jgi:hypothetical protein
MPHRGAKAWTGSAWDDIGDSRLLTHTHNGGANGANIPQSAVTNLTTDLGSKLDIAGGKILQVVSSTTSTQAVISSGTFTDTNLSASIVPSSSNNKVLVLISQNVGTYSTNNDRALSAIRTVRNSTEIFGSGSVYNFGMLVDTATLGIFEVAGLWYSVSHLDSPNTTSSCTYKTQAKTNTATAAVAQVLGSSSSITLLEVSA